MLRWGVKELASRAGISPTTVNRFERELVEPISVTRAAIQRVFEEAGIEFKNGCVCLTPRK
jgi:hypothetical protein